MYDSEFSRVCECATASQRPCVGDGRVRCATASQKPCVGDGRVRCATASQKPCVGDGRVRCAMASQKPCVGDGRVRCAMASQRPCVGDGRVRCAMASQKPCVGDGRVRCAMASQRPCVGDGRVRCAMASQRPCVGDGRVRCVTASQKPCVGDDRVRCVTASQKPVCALRPPPRAFHSLPETGGIVRSTLRTASPTLIQSAALDQGQSSGRAGRVPGHRVEVNVLGYLMCSRRFIDVVVLARAGLPEVAESPTAIADGESVEELRTVRFEPRDGLLTDGSLDVGQNPMRLVISPTRPDEQMNVFRHYDPCP